MGFQNGLYRDSHESRQPEGTYRLASNVKLSRDGQSLDNEKGTTLSHTIASNLDFNHEVVGSTYLHDGRTVLFSRFINPDRKVTVVINVAGSQGDNFVLDLDGTDYSQELATDVTTMLDDWVTTHTAALSALGVSLAREGTNTLILYVPDDELAVTDESDASFTDNVVTYIGLSSLSQIGTFKDGVYKVILDDSSWNDNNKLAFGNLIEATSRVNNRKETLVYWTDGVNYPRSVNLDTETNLERSVTDFSIFALVDSVPTITFNGLTSGGSLKTGAYNIGVAYVKDDNTPSNWVTVTQPISVNEEVNFFPINNYDGAENDFPTSRAISLSLTNLDSNYNKVRLALIKGADVRILPDYTVALDDSGNFNVTISGNEAYTIGSLEEINVPSAYYTRAKTLVQVDDKLYLGNLESPLASITGQKYANNIVVTAASDTFDIVNGLGYKNNSFSFTSKSFRRDEVYALYIAWVLKDGSETKAYHIPGRAPGKGTSAGFIHFKEDAPSSIKPASVRIEFYGPEVTTSASVHTLSMTNGPIADASLDIPISAGLSLSQIADAYASSFADEVGLGQNLTIVKDPNNPNAIFIRNSTGTNVSWNGAQFSITASPRDGLRSNALTTNVSMTGGGDTAGLSIGSTDITIYGQTVTHNVIGGTTAANLALEVKALLEADATINANYTMSISGGDAGKLLITAQTANNATFASEITNTYYLIDGMSMEIGDITGGNAYWIGNENELITDLIDAETSDIRTAFNIPGGEYDDAKLFHFSGAADPDRGMGYWENASEVYPDNDEWDIWSVSDGEGYNTLRSLRGQNVRHHRFPEHAADNHFDGTDTSDNASTLGFTLSNVVLPDDLLNQVIGFKIYFAERTTNNKTVIDQGHFLYSRLSGGDTYTTQNKASDPATTNAYGSDIGATNPFYLMRTRASIAQIDHVKSVANINETVHSDNLGITSYVPPTTPLCQRVVARSYVENNEASTNISPFGFTRSFYDNTDGESKIVFELAANLDSVAGPSQNNHLLNYKSFKKDVYLSFENQSLVYTGFYNQGALSGTSATILGGDTFICPFSIKAHQASTTLTHTIICESDDNIVFRHSGVEDWESYYPNASLTAFESPTEFPAGAVDAFDVDNYYYYNPEYSYLQNWHTALPNDPENIDSTCFPTRVLKSAEDTGGSLDYFKSFKAEDYYDLPKHRGPITHLGRIGNTIIIHMENGVFRTRGREELQFDDVRAFIGSGDIFTVEPTELGSTEIGLGGLQDQRAAVTTISGYYWIDRRAKRAYKIDQNGMTDISSGMTYWFEDNLLPSNLHAVEDQVEDRILFTSSDSTNPFTISLSQLSGKWISNHSYVPDSYFSTPTKLYSTLIDEIYEHYTGNYGLFYGTQYSCFVEFIQNEPINIHKQVAYLLMQTVMDDGSEVLEKTFDKYRVQNSFQDTGTVPIVTTNTFVRNAGNTRRFKGLWRTNIGRDTLNIPDVADRRYPLLSNYQKRLIDRWHSVRLTCDNLDNNLLQLFHAELISRQSKI